MAKKITKKAVQDSLIAQLTAMGADVDFYKSMVSDYMALWATKERLIEDINNVGPVYYEPNTAGVPIHKNNPSVRDLASTNKAMLTILDKLGLSTDVVGKLGEADDL